jgi:hypothetical protein
LFLEQKYLTVLSESFILATLIAVQKKILAMSKYVTENALQELDNVEETILQKVEEHLEKSEALEVAKILTLVSRESYRIDEEARRLRLTGELDLDIYNILSKGYHGIATRIMQISYEYKLAHEVSALHKGMKFSRDMDTYLAEYVRSLVE